MSADPALLVDGSDLASANCKLIAADDLFSSPLKRGNNITFPYADGETRTDKKTAARTISVTYLLSGGDSSGLVVSGSEYAYLQKVYSDLLALLPDATAGDDMSCTLTRRVVYPAPTGTVNKTAEAEFLGAIYAQDPTSPRHARVTLEFRLLDGAFS